MLNLYALPSHKGYPILFAFPHSFQLTPFWFCCLFSWSFWHLLRKTDHGTYNKVRELSGLHWDCAFHRMEVGMGQAVTSRVYWLFIFTAFLLLPGLQVCLWENNHSAVLLFYKLGLDAVPQVWAPLLPGGSFHAQ